ncbi:type IV pilus assembly protein PilA [Allofrancisella inopinata]|uniref:Prepilin-type N-terminal cleavage/methylation domain-containing protein n=1 Tax=Allofrancisella inopinata TaxID=1085647 RepID=A0AAE6YHN5_9GAMM|nr:pilin [Allofrancisella inopinata]QIV95741.1 prepilin-type N-terminal cleavage/methylation domain-containing protein [Allofrancisella inopinata]TDT67967.1 type IV pilus assembly protein PilA [Allofrancisella inopinata]
MKKTTQKGFSLVELMVVIAIIAILAAVAVPMYSNYTTRAKIGSELSKLGGAKAQVAEGIANNNGSVTGVTASDLPSGASVTDGVISLTSTEVSGATITLTPTAASGAITWACNVNGVTSSQVPSNCTNN